MQGHDTFKPRSSRLSESTLEAVERAGLGARRDRPVRLPPGQRAHPRAVGERLGLDPSASIDCIDRYGNTSAATIPIALRRRAERGMLEPGTNVLLAAFGAGFTWGAGVIQWGASNGRPEGCALVTGASRGHRRRDRQGAGRGGLAGRRELPLATPTRAEAVVERDRRTPAAGRSRARPTSSDPDAADALLQARSRRSSGPVLVLVNNAGVRADNLSPADRRRGLAAGDRHQPLGRVPADPPRAAADDPRALRPRGQHGVGRRPARQPGPGQLRRLQGRAGGHDQDRGRRGGAPRRDRQRRGPGPDRDGHDRGPGRRACWSWCRPAALGTPEEVAACVRFLASDEAALRDRRRA